MKLLITVAMLLSIVGTAKADPPTPAVQDIPTGADKIYPLRKGDVAPYDGQLFDNATGMRWGNWLMQYKLRLNNDVAYEQKLRTDDAKLCEERRAISDQKYAIVTDTYQSNVAIMSAQLTQAQYEASNPPWYRSPFFSFTLGVVTTGVMLTFTVYSLK